MSAKWGPSLSLFQIRVLRHPENYPFPDTLRVAAVIRNPVANAEAAFAISSGGKDWSKWSTFRDKLHLPYVGLNYIIKTGHPHAGDWSK